MKIVSLAKDFCRAVNNWLEEFANTPSHPRPEVRAALEDKGYKFSRETIVVPVMYHAGFAEVTHIDAPNGKRINPHGDDALAQQYRADYEAATAAYNQKKEAAAAAAPVRKL